MDAVLAHVGRAIAPHDLWSSWGKDPFVYGGVLLTGWLYFRGVRSVWATAGGGRGVARWRAGCFLAGLGVCWAALESPIDAAGSALFSGHMLQHELLTVVAAPLLVLGDPLVAVTRSLPPAWRRRVGRAARLLTGPARSSRRTPWAVAWFGIFVASFWIWHIPALYETALRSDVVHSLQHFSFLASALGFWWVAIGGARHRSPLPGVAMSFGAMVQGTWGGVVLLFSERGIYEPYATTTQAWGLSPSADIAVGAAIMMAAGSVFVAAGIALVGSYLASVERAEGMPAPPVDVSPARPTRA